MPESHNLDLSGRLHTAIHHVVAPVQERTDAGPASHADAQMGRARQGFGTGEQSQAKTLGRRRVIARNVPDDLFKISPGLRA